MLVERHGWNPVMPAAARMLLTDDILDGTVIAVGEIALRLAPFLKLA